jgi:hypothetical protein
MSSNKIGRSLLAIVLTCVIALNGFVNPAFAETGTAVDSFSKGFWEGLGGIVGGAAGVVLVCYGVDVVILPIAPPVAAYLATICPVVGGVVGGTGGAELVKEAVEHAA